jgi:hypothetical protein
MLSGSDAFVAQLSADYKSLAAFTYMGGGGSDGPLRSGVDSAGRIHTISGSSSDALPVTAGGTPYSGGRDFYWTALDQNLTRVELGTYFGSVDDDVPWNAAYTATAAK